MESATLLKFGEKCHLEVLRDHGIVFMNTLQFFKELEEISGRGDCWEGVATYESGAYGIATSKTPEGKEITMQISSWNYREELAFVSQFNVFCMYALRPSQGAFPVPEENFRLGDHVLVLLDAQEFMDRLVSSAKNTGIFHSAGLVAYVSNDYKGRLGLFKKRDIFSYQHEWRLVCKNGNGYPRTLEIGSLGSISRIIRSDEVNQELHII